MSKIIPIHQVFPLKNTVDRLENAYRLREALIGKIAAFNIVEDSLKKDSGFLYRVGKEIVECMKDPLINDKLPIDEIIAIAECRIKKADETVREMNQDLARNFDIQIEDKR